MVQLERPSNKLIESYLSFVEEMRANGDKIWEGFNPKADETYDAFVNRILVAESDPAPGLVAETTYWATEDGNVVGRIALRHALNSDLEEFGGHIGYEVRPSSRRRGVAREMLRLVLETPKAQSIGKILLTCAPDNVASNKTIVANGGKLEKTAFVEKWQRQTNYYWIDLSTR